MKKHTHLLDGLSKRFSKKPEDLPQDHYVYAIYVDRKLRYIGKGTGNRAWAHYAMISKMLISFICGEDEPSNVLYFHRRTLKRLLQSDDACVVVKILRDGLTEQAAFDLEVKTISQLPLAVERSDGEGLWNVGGHGLSVGSRIGRAEEKHKLGISGERKSKGRKRPTRRERQEKKSFFGSEFGTNAYKTKDSLH